MDYSRRSMEDSVVERDMNCECLEQEVSEKSVSMWPRNCFCDILLKKVAALCLCLKSLPEAKVKKCELISLAEEN